MQLNKISEEKCNVYLDSELILSDLVDAQEVMAAIENNYEIQTQKDTQKMKLNSKIILEDLESFISKMKNGTMIKVN